MVPECGIVNPLSGLRSYLPPRLFCDADTPQANSPGCGLSFRTHPVRSCSGASTHFIAELTADCAPGGEEHRGDPRMGPGGMRAAEAALAARAISKLASCAHGANLGQRLAVGLLGFDFRRDVRHDLGKFVLQLRRLQFQWSGLSNNPPSSSLIPPPCEGFSALRRRARGSRPI